MSKFLSSFTITSITRTKVVIIGTSLAVCIVLIAKRYFANTSTTNSETKLTLNPIDTNHSERTEDLTDLTHPKTASNCYSRTQKNKSGKNLSKNCDNTDSNEVSVQKTSSLNTNSSENKASNKRQTISMKKFYSNKKRKSDNYGSGSQQRKACFYCRAKDHLINDCPVIQKSKSFNNNSNNYSVNKRLTSEKMRPHFNDKECEQLLNSNPNVKPIATFIDKEDFQNQRSNTCYSISTIVYYLVLGFFIFLLLNVIYMQYV